MKKKLKKILGPSSGWCLIVWPILSTIFLKMVDSLIESFWGPDDFKQWINTSVSTTNRTIILWCFPIAVFLLFLCIFIYRQGLKKYAPLVTESNEKIIAIIDHLLQDDNVESAQAYRYSSHWSSGRKIRFVKFSLYYGKADEQVDINAVLQNYCYIPKEYYNQLMTAKRKYAQATAPGIDKESNEWYEYLNVAVDLCEKIYIELNNLSSYNDLQDYHYSLYRILTAILPTLVKPNGDMYVFTNHIEDVEIENRLKSRKDGLLGGFALGNCYIFCNQTSINKQGRIYAVYVIDTETIMLISIPESFEKKDYNNRLAYCQALFSSATQLQA